MHVEAIVSGDIGSVGRNHYRVKTEMTREDVLKGDWCHPNRCPVARRLTLATGMLATVESKIMFLREAGGERWWAATPPEVEDFIKEFDSAQLHEDRMAVAPVGLDIMFTRVPGGEYVEG